MKLTLDQVKHVAKLANLPLSEEETEEYSGQLSKILDYIDTLEKAHTEGIDPTFNVTGQNNIFRNDETSECLSQEQALKNAPLEKQGSFATKGIFEEQ